MKGWIASLPKEQRMLPVEHGNTLPEQWEAGKRLFLQRKEPLLMLRIGDCEISLLTAGTLEEGWRLAHEKYATGCFEEGIHLRQDFISAVNEAHILGVQQDWGPDRVTERTALLLRMLGMELPMASAVDFHLTYKLLTDGTLFNYLANKRVLLIGYLSQKLRERFLDPLFMDAYQFLGPMDKIKIVGHLQTTHRDHGGSHRDYEATVEAASKIDYDVALIAAGSMAKPLAWRLWKTGKTALDVGFVFDALCGDGERQHRPALRDAHWPNW